MRTIPLTQDKVALVDDADFDALNAHKWYAIESNNGVFYAARCVTRDDGKQRLVRMHREILGVHADRTF